MRNLMLIVAGVALTIAVLALAFPAAFAHFDSYDIAWIGALLAMGGAIAWRMSKRTTDADPAAYGFNAPRPRSWAQGLTYALIWAAILFIAMAAYSLSDWAYNVGQLIRALIT